MLKQNSYFFSNFFYKNVNAKRIPSDHKLTDVTPCYNFYEKKSKTSKENYRLLRILPNISKFFKRCLCNQYFDNIFSKYRCGFGKGYNSQHCLITVTEKWRERVDKGDVFRGSLTHQLKVFDCLPNELLITKLHVYDFDIKSLNLIYDYLSIRKQRVKVGGAYSSW